MKETEVNSILKAFESQKILVIGDVILDAYYHGKVDRISPEAPVSVLDVDQKDYRLGGAANVALNIKSLGATPILCSVIGSDSGGSRVLELLDQADIKLDGLRSSEYRTTSVKTRLMSGNRQLIRIDEEQTDLISSEDEEELIHLIVQAIESHKPDAILFEDYDKGVLSAMLISKVIEMARAHDIPVTVDPKKRNFLAYAGATLFKPNLKELREGLNNPDIKPTEESLAKAFEFLSDVMPVHMALFTLSSHGMYITNGDDKLLLSTKAQDIADVSGAGDTVIAAATCALAAGCSMPQIVQIANAAAGWVCQQPGVVAIHAEMLKIQLHS